MPIQLVLNKARVPVKVFTRDIEHDALRQLLNVAQLPIVFGHVAAYKDIDRVMADQTDLVDIVHTLKQVICIKG